MKKREILNRIKILKQQLQLMTDYEEDFLNHLSFSELQERKDAILDELITRLKALKEFD